MASTMTGTRKRPPTTPRYPRVEVRTPKLKKRKNQPNTRSSNRVNKSCFRSRGRNKSAASAGLRLSELIVEITVDIAIVSANCRKNWPTMPEMNAHGTKTADSTRPTAMIGPATSSMARIAASRGVRPCSM